MTKVTQLQIEKADALNLWIDNEYSLYKDKFNLFIDYQSGSIGIHTFTRKLKLIARRATMYCTDYSNIGQNSINLAVRSMLEEYEAEKHNYIGQKKMTGSN